MYKEEVVRLGSGLSVGSRFNVEGTENDEPDGEKKKKK